MKRKGGRKPKLNAAQAERVREMYARTSCSMERLAAHFNVSQGTIASVLDRKGPYA